MFDFLGQKVGLVEKQNHRHISETAVVDNRVKNVDALDQAIRYSVFQKRLVKCARGHKKKDGRDFVKTLKPLLSL